MIVNKYLISDIVGIIGVLLYLIAYFKTKTNHKFSSRTSYFILGLIGSMCLIYSLCYNFNLASFILEIIWFIFCIYNFCRLKLGRSKAQKIRHKALKNKINKTNTR